MNLGEHRDELKGIFPVPAIGGQGDRFHHESDHFYEIDGVLYGIGEFIAVFRLPVRHIDEDAAALGQQAGDIDAQGAVIVEGADECGGIFRRLAVGGDPRQIQGAVHLDHIRRIIVFDHVQVIVNLEP